MADAQHTPIVERLRVSGDDLARIRWGEDRANVIKAADIITDLLEALEEVVAILRHNPDASEPPRYRNARASKIADAAINKARARSEGR